MKKRHKKNKGKSQWKLKSISWSLLVYLVVDFIFWPGFQKNDGEARIYQTRGSTNGVVAWKSLSLIPLHLTSKNIEESWLSWITEMKREKGEYKKTWERRHWMVGNCKQEKVQKVEKGVAKRERLKIYDLLGNLNLLFFT